MYSFSGFQHVMVSMDEERMAWGRVRVLAACGLWTVVSGVVVCDDRDDCVVLEFRVLVKHGGSAVGKTQLHFLWFGHVLVTILILSNWCCSFRY